MTKIGKIDKVKNYKPANLKCGFCTVSCGNEHCSYSLADNLSSEVDKDYVVAFGGRVVCINKSYLAEHGKSENLEDLKMFHLQVLKIYDKIDKVDPSLLRPGVLKGLDRFLRTAKNCIAKLSGRKWNENMYKFWEVPKCSCPYEVNILKFPDGDYVVNETCAVHGSV